MNDIKNLLSNNGLLDKVIDKMLVKSIDDSKMDGIVFKYLDKNVYQITNDIVFKQCSKCKNFKEIKQFPKLSKSSNCLFNKNYFCSQCIKESRPKEKEHQYYLTRCKKQNPNYVPLSERMTLKKKKEIEKAEKQKAKLEKSTNLANTNIQIEKPVEIVEVKPEPIVIKEVNKVVPLKDIPVDIKLDEKKQRKTKQKPSVPLYNPIVPVVEKVVVDLTVKKIPRRQNNNETSLSEQKSSLQSKPSSSKKTAKSK